MSKPLLRHMFWLVLALCASPAHAHAPIPGIKGFYVGLLHPASTPPQALLMLGLGLLLGRFAADRAKWFFGAFLLSLIIGVFTGFAALDLDTAMFLVAVVTGVHAALAPGKLAPLAIGLAALGGVLIGVASIPDAGPT